VPLPAQTPGGRRDFFVSPSAKTAYKYRMDRIDREIVNEIQSHFPLRSRPFREVGKKLRLSEKEVLLRVSRLKNEGIIRRIGANFNSRRLGFTSTLCAAKVPKDKLADFIEAVNRYPGVTHNYERDGDYNIWFTFIGESAKSIEQSLEEIKTGTGINDLISLPAEKIFKIRVDFEV
jgi:DNA-binding Lrp family transcriptional regulator